jgi:uncharacterized protein (TIGR03067 family)
VSELEGVWARQSATVNGERSDEDVLEHRLTLKGQEYKIECKYGMMFESTYAIDTAPDPKHFDLMCVGEQAGKIAKGIYELDGDLLTLCYSLPGKDRPQTFASPAGSERQLFVWRRMENDE